MRDRLDFFIDRLAPLRESCLDLLSTVLRELRFEAAAFRRLELRAPWSLTFDQAGVRGIHIVVAGRCEMVFAGTAPIILETGDLIIAPRADEHMLRAVGRRSPSPMSARAIADRSEAGRIRAGAGGEETVIVCGAFVFGDADEVMLSALPRLVHVRGEDGNPPDWLNGYVETIMSEVSDDEPGSDVVQARLANAIVIKALRRHLNKTEEAGWFKGLQDPNIAKALGMIHAEFGRSWTLESLAREAGLSRAAFAARFSALVGEPAMRYLHRCRMRHAAGLLAGRQARLAAVAEAVGYGSEAAFSAAFKRYADVTPGTFRRLRAANDLATDARAAAAPRRVSRYGAAP